MLQKRLLLSSLVSAMLIAQAAALGRDLAITVRNLPIQAAAVVEQGQIMLPLRETFASLNSTVWYDSQTGEITARNNLHVLILRTGSRTALLDGHKVALEFPIRTINHRVYMPAAFAAQAMGAIIRYDANSHTISVNGSPPFSQLANAHDHGQVLSQEAKRRPEYNAPNTSSDPTANTGYVSNSPYSWAVPNGYGVPVIGSPIGVNFNPICFPQVVYHVGFQQLFPIRSCAATFINGLCLSRSPLFPLLQCSPGAIFTPVYFPHHHFRHIHP